MKGVDECDGPSVDGEVVDAGRTEEQWKAGDENSQVALV